VESRHIVLNVRIVDSDPEPTSFAFNMGQPNIARASRLGRR
jgi:hypothetical protein